MPQDDTTPTKTDAVWRVEMLGGLRALPVSPSESGAEPVEQFRTHKAALLLARLALFPHRTHAREELADLLWPDTTTERGRANLTQTLVYLRQALHEPRAGGLLVADHKTVRVSRGLLQTDVAEWEAAATRALTASSRPHPEQAALLTAALNAYTGDLLPGFYDDWVCDERIRLTALHEELQDRLKTLSAAPHTPPIRLTDCPPTQPVPGASAPESCTVLNVPLYLTRFFGRESERAEALRLLRHSPPVRLLTLLGMGGIGKTRLAFEIGQAVCVTDGEGDSSPKGVSSPAPFGWAAFVSLAEARTSAHMESVLLHALGVKSDGADTLTDVMQFLRGQAAAMAPGEDQATNRLLLVLDNLEQLGQASAPIVARLLTGVPNLTILTTSRQPLQIPGEQELALGPLFGGARGKSEGLPDDVRLFVDRARLVRPSFALTPENESAVAMLCLLLEGVPLALELAAAWIRVATPAQIVDRLSDRFRLLAARGMVKANDLVPLRHRSLHATIAWSYDLLEPALQTTFAQLSVFRGGWTVEAAQAVTDADDVHEPLLLLAERSLIQFEEPGDGHAPRYRMLESLREFADEQLSFSERESLRLRHARYFDALSQKAAQPRQTGTRETRPLLPDDRDNLYAAILSGLEPKADENLPEEHRVHSLRIVLQSPWLWTLNEQKDLLTLAFAVLPRLSDEIRGPLTASLLLERGTNALLRGDFELARQSLESGLAACRESGDRTGAARTKNRLANLAYCIGDRVGAVAAWIECLEEARRLDDEPMESVILNNLAVVSPDLADRRRFSERAVALNRLHTPDSHLLASSLNTLANAAREQRDFDTALCCLEEAYPLACADGASGMAGIVQTSLVELFLETGDQLGRAHDLLCAAETVFESHGSLTRVAEVQYLRFRLAIAQDNTEEAIHRACQHLRLLHQSGAGDAALAAAHADMTDRLRKSGFAAQIERLTVAESQQRNVS